MHGHLCTMRGHVLRTLCSVSATGARFALSLQLVIFVLVVSLAPSLGVLTCGPACGSLVLVRVGVKIPQD